MIVRRDAESASVNSGEWLWWTTPRKGLYAGRSVQFVLQSATRRSELTPTQSAR